MMNSQSCHIYSEIFVSVLQLYQKLSQNEFAVRWRTWFLLANDIVVLIAYLTHSEKERRYFRLHWNLGHELLAVADALI